MTADAFAVLRCDPTLDEATIKRAYYAELRNHPPHQDPDGFRRLREAYEALLDPQKRAERFLAAPVDVGAWLRRSDERYGEALRAAEEGRGEDGDEGSAARVARFVEAWSRLSLAQAIERAG